MDDARTQAAREGVRAALANADKLTEALTLIDGVLGQVEAAIAAELARARALKDRGPPDAPAGRCTS